jgi:class I lanthipeptide synthase
LSALDRAPPRAAAWESVLDPGRRAAALRVAHEVGRRAGDPARVAASLAAAREQTHYPKTVRDRPSSVADGDAGIALMCAYLDACSPGDGWDAIGHGFLARAAGGAESEPGLGPGLFSGLSGLAFTAAQLSRGRTRYQRLLTALDDALAAPSAALGASLRRAPEPRGMSEFDAISGASGVAAHLVGRDPHGVLPDVLGGLVSLADPVGGPPRWMTPARFIADEETARRYPFGNLNCGLAHGVPGPLAALALASRAGVEVEGQRDAMRAFAAWLAAHRCDDEWGVNWPTAVPLPAPGEPAIDVAALHASRSAWCYGSPGIARALWLAGDALDDAGLRELAVEAMLAVHARPVAVRFVPSPTFCHGVAGLLQIVLRFAHDTGLPAFRDAAAELVDELLAAYDPQRPLGYASLEPGGNPVDRPGLLDGAPGVALVLLAAATDVEPTWDRLFLLS